ncbi:hypothetical protein BO94DRAFT_569663 [Aspergillus sclerotioniger CBS 115572]|uniref:Uncharacterized protein n=1 Tax=Aspergillus sclerotioniger CBS 115572 TaxID=1450535 RepID=A0A317V5N3_9EURO|nr:hypothetical protein BO94DRAFT_569663 [Aspergillus sclerotioniger CBS 115572]PWY69603.1 hypothetical protein BO94DRAFT_569663 [Aspergillus sclerotioniger CBS 115572]
MKDAVPSAEEGRTVYEKGFRIWQSLYMRAMERSDLPQTCFQIQPALQHQPYFPDDLNLKLAYKKLWASGTSIWEGSSENCTIPPLQRHVQIGVSADIPTPLIVSTNPDRSHQQWFNTDENHLTVLIFAWSHILSARWAELMPEAILTYTDSKACNSDKAENKILSCNRCMVSDTAISAATAFGFLSDYCSLHKIVDQGYAALSAVLLLPQLPGRGKGIEDHHLDKLLTLSCTGGAIHSLLASVFYEPGIACNVASPWLQSIFAVVNSVDDDRILIHMLMSRVPHLAFFWLGGAILGSHKQVLRDGQFGFIPTDIDVAAWSGTMQSFMQEPIHPATNSSILRSDKCRILYLIQEDRHTRWPICPWMPFGATALENTEIDVRLHANCTGHGLRYAGWKWTCQNGRVVEPIMPNITINYDALNPGEECESKNETRCMFGWLRREGYPPQEKRIHEWIELNGLDGRLSPDKDSGEGHKASRTDVEDWIDHIVCDDDP